MSKNLQEIVNNFELYLPVSIQIHLNLDELTDKLLFEFLKTKVKNNDVGDGVYEFDVKDLQKAFIDDEYYSNAIDECNNLPYEFLLNDPHSPLGAYTLWNMVHIHPNLLKVYVTGYNIGTIKASLKDESALEQLQNRNVATNVIECVLNLRMFLSQEQTDMFNKLIIANDGMSNYYLARNFYIFMKYEDLMNALNFVKCTELLQVFDGINDAFKTDNVSYLIVTDYDKY